jgi:hypothetical protein
VPSLRAPTVSRWIVALRLPAAMFSSRRVSAQRPPRPPRQLGRGERVLVGAVLRAEAAAHVLADHPHLVLRQSERGGDLGPDAPDVLGRDVQMQDVADPLADGLVRLHRVVEDRLRAVGGVDHDVRLGESPVEVAALLSPRLFGEEPALDRLLRIEDELELLPLDLDRVQSGPRLSERVGRDRRHGRTDEPCLLLEAGRLPRPDHCAHARQFERRRDVDPSHPCMRVRGAQERGLEHAGQAEIGGVAGLAAHALGSVLACRRTADDRLRPGRPLLERVLFDDEPHLLEPALDLLLGADQSRHVRIASSIFGYVPQRQRLPAMW